MNGVDAASVSWTVGAEDDGYRQLWRARQRVSDLPAREACCHPDYSWSLTPFRAGFLTEGGDDVPGQPLPPVGEKAQSARQSEHRHHISAASGTLVHECRQLCLPLGPRLHPPTGDLGPLSFGLRHEAHVDHVES
jgi:hypothetical protein